MTQYPDIPKSLGIEAVRQERLSLIEQRHMLVLTNFVRGLRNEFGLTTEIPFFDPLDGGIDARCLCLYEAPGAKAVESGFISRNNPDETAKNSFSLYQEAGISRTDTILWNIVPWYIGTGEHIRPANGSDIRQGMPYLARLISMLPRLTVILLVGKKAQKANSHIVELRPDLPLFHCFHPSPLFVNNREGNKGIILEVLKQVAAVLNRNMKK
ncbi:MAG: uracil-DNA glycosylase [Bacteroidales bacterium]|nr:uracil-DNA glycosylase [Bacteroidales bacterium]